MLSVLVIDNNDHAASDLSFCLQVKYPGAGFTVAHDEREAMDLLCEDTPDVIFLKASAVCEDSVSFISTIREHSRSPLIVISKNETAIDRARGLEAGADDYISPDYSPIELLARCRALLRRSQGLEFASHRSIALDGMRIDFVLREVQVAGQPIHLTPHEFGVLAELVRNEGRVVATQDLLDRVWGDEYVGDSNLVKTCVYRLRHKIDPADGGHVSILNEHGLGYRVVVHKP